MKHALIDYVNEYLAWDIYNEYIESVNKYKCIELRDKRKAIC